MDKIEEAMGTNENRIRGLDVDWKGQSGKRRGWELEETSYGETGRGIRTHGEVWKRSHRAGEPGEGNITGAKG